MSLSRFDIRRSVDIRSGWLRMCGCPFSCLLAAMNSTGFGKRTGRHASGHSRRVPAAWHVKPAQHAAACELALDDRARLQERIAKLAQPSLTPPIQRRRQVCASRVEPSLPLDLERQHQLCRLLYHRRQQRFCDRCVVFGLVTESIGDIDQKAALYVLQVYADAL